MSNRSLRRDLLKSLALPIAGSVIVVAIVASLFIYEEIQEVYDATLAQYARTLAYTIPNEGSETQLAGVTGALQPYERKIAYRVFEGDHLLAQSSGAPAPEHLEPGFSDTKINARPWRFFVLIDPVNGERVEVGERYAIRHELAFQLLGSLIIPAILLIAMMMVVVWRAATRGLARLSNVSRAVDARAADDLTPIATHQAPEEIEPLIDALNRLFVRIHDSFARERQFTDNAAHELRTPLAAIKTQAQVLQRTQTLTAEGAQQLDNLLQAVDRASQMTATLLAFARLQNETTPHAPCQLDDIIRAELHGLATLAQQHNVTLSYSSTGSARVIGQREGLSVLVRNLIENAIKFSPGAATITIRSEQNNDQLRLSVCDHGPGIPAAQRDKVFERFYRINKSSHSGTGLGLAMVKWVADQHHAHIALGDNTPSGLIVTVTFAHA